MNAQLTHLHRRHRHLNRLIDNCRAALRQDELKALKRLRLRIRDRIAALQRTSQPSG